MKTKVGLVDNTIYLFGLMDREEYQISCSSNLIEEVREYLLLNMPEIITIETDGVSRLGVSLSLRENNHDAIINLIQHICSIKNLVPAQ